MKKYEENMKEISKVHKGIREYMLPYTRDMVLREITDIGPWNLKEFQALQCGGIANSGFRGYPREKT